MSHFQRISWWHQFLFANKKFIVFFFLNDSTLIVNKEINNSSFSILKSRNRHWRLNAPKTQRQLMWLCARVRVWSSPTVTEISCQPPASQQDESLLLTAPRHCRLREPSIHSSVRPSVCLSVPLQPAPWRRKNTHGRRHGSVQKHKQKKTGFGTESKRTKGQKS